MTTISPIKSREDLHGYLQIALKLEHATVPPYIFALYSIHRGTNLDAFNILRVVVIEEMLHMTLVANLLNAVGGKPDLTADGFVQNYPTYLPTGEDDFEVGLEKFSRNAVETFLKIERPKEQPNPKEEKVRIHNEVAYVHPSQQKESNFRAGKSLLPVVAVKDEHGNDLHLHFYSIGEFYSAIGKGIEYLCKEIGEAELFCGDITKQVSPEYYFSGGGELFTVEDRKTAMAAIDQISGQGEGYGDSIFDESGEYSHYYRFQQLHLGRFYQLTDKPDHPTGATLKVDWDAVYPCKTNPTINDFGSSEELVQMARVFNGKYRRMLIDINDAFNGAPDKLVGAIKGMHGIADAAQYLMRNPIPGGHENAAPTFEVNQVLYPENKNLSYAEN